MDKRPSVLRLEQIHKRFGPLEILHGVSLTLAPGSSTVILGPSGSGKSTLLHIAGLMERPTGGAVYVDETDTSSFSDQQLAGIRLNSIGFLFQFHYLLPEFTALENVLIPARLAGDDIETATKEAKSLMAKLGLAERLDHKPNQLSGGEQQRAAFARAMLRRPKLLLCDEPTGNLDQQTADEMMNLLWHEIRDRGTSAIVVTHNELLARHAGASYHLEKGVFREIGMEART